MNNRDVFVHETLAMLKERYGVSLSELVDAFHGEVSLPASIFASALTPLEAAVSFLSVQKNFSYKSISESLSRPVSTIKNAAKNASAKGLVVVEDMSLHRVPLSAFDDILTPGESVIFSLVSQGLRNVDVASLIGKDPRNVWQIYQRALKKRGGLDA